MWRTVGLLAVANVFMTIAWYAHLRDLRDKPIWVAILFSWGVAFLEYCIQVPANRVGYGTLSLQQLKILQEIVTLVVFAGFSVVWMRERLTWNYGAACVCMAAAAWFMFRAPRPGEAVAPRAPGEPTVPSVTGAGEGAPR
jgi:uncharacterized protein (DUF486 family)